MTRRWTAVLAMLAALAYSVAIGAGTARLPGSTPRIAALARSTVSPDRRSPVGHVALRLQTIALSAGQRSPIERRRVRGRPLVAHRVLTGQHLTSGMWRHGGDWPRFRLAPRASWAGFRGTSFSDEGRGATEPPDTQIGAGPADLMEMVNGAWSVWTKAGAQVADGTLSSFFGVTTGYTATDPQLVYDVSSGHWFASCTAVNSAGDSQLRLAVSTASDPTRGWTVYLLKSVTAMVMDQPMLGLGSATLVLTWDDYTGIVSDNPDSGTLAGSETVLVNKQDLVDGASALHTSAFGPDSRRFRLVPVRSAAPGAATYLAYYIPKPASLGIVAIEGLPGGATQPTWSEADVAIHAVHSPPAAVQPGNGPPISTDTTSLLSAAGQSGTVWAAANDAITPAGDTTTRSGLRFIEFRMEGTTLAVVQDFDVAAPDAYLDYPAVALDGAGDMVASYTESSSVMFASAAALGQPVTAAPDTTVELGSLGAGTGVYNCGGCFTGGFNGVRWGDYSGAAPDPSASAVVWLAGEYAASGGNPNNWGTGVRPVSFGMALPTVTDTPAPTDTPTPTSPPVAAATLLPQPTPTPTDTVSGVRLIRVTVRPSAHGVTVLDGAYPAGRRFTFAIEVSVDGLRRGTTVSYSWLVMRGGHVAAHHGRSSVLQTAGTGRYWARWERLLLKPGSYVFHGAAAVDGVTQSRTAAFRLRP